MMTNRWSKIHVGEAAGIFTNTLLVPPVILVERHGCLPVLLLYAYVRFVRQPRHGAAHLAVHEPGQLSVDTDVICVIERGPVNIRASPCAVQKLNYLKKKA